MKRIITVTLLICCMSMSGCGRTIETYTPPTDSEVVESNIKTTDGDYIVIGSADEEAYATYGKSKETTVEETPKEVLEEVVEEAPKNASVSPTEAKGLLILEMHWLNLNQLDFNFYMVDPETGKYEPAAKFTFDDPSYSSSRDVIQPAYPIFANYSDIISQDWTKVAATKIFHENQATHAGWIDANGEFFDVTEALNEQEQDVFEDALEWEAHGFQDELFIYSLKLGYGKAPKYRAVDINDLRPGASWEIESPSSLVPGYGGSYKCHPTEWLDDNSYLGFYFTKTGAALSEYNVANEDTKTVLSTEDRMSWSPVRNPEQTMIAFLSTPQQTNVAPSFGLYTMSSDYSDRPTEIKTNVLIDCSSLGYIPAFSVVGPTANGITYQILDWR